MRSPGEEYEAARMTRYSGANTVVLLLLFSIVDNAYCDTIVDCGGYIDATGIVNGTTSSPNYPGTYPNRTHCIWLVEGMQAKYLHVELLSLGTDPRDNCQDFIELRAGGSDKEQLYYGCNATQRAIDVPGRFLWIRFYSNGASEDAGFTLTYTNTDTNITRGPGVEPVYVWGTTSYFTGPIPSCPMTQFACANRECLSWAWVCDGYADCGCLSGCDEDGCLVKEYSTVHRFAIGISIGVFTFIVTVTIVMLAERWRPWPPFRSRDNVKRPVRYPKVKLRKKTMPT